MPFLSILAIVFITLKLTDVIDWSWWAVTAPLWAIPAVLLTGVVTWFTTLVIKETRK